MSIRIKLYIYLAGFSALLLGVLIVFYQVSYDTLRDRVVTDAKLIAVQISQQLHNDINFIEEDMRLFVVSQNLEDIEKSVALRNLPSVQMLRRRFINFFEREYSYQLYGNIAIFDTNGDVLESTAPCKNPSSEKWWEDVVKYGVSYSLLEDDARGHDVSVAILLADNNGEAWGVMQGTIPIGSLIRRGGLSLKDIDAHQVDLIAPDGRYLYSTAQHTPGQLSENAQHILNKPEKDDHLHTHYSGTRTLDIVLPHKHGKRGSLQWDLIIHLDYDKTFASVLALRWWIGGSVSLILLIGSIFLVMLTRGISRPLIDLANTAEAFGSGDLKTRVQGELSGEFQVLASSFNDMAKNIEEAQEDLERLVEERTQNLTETNETLQEEIEERERVQLALQKTSAILKAAMDCSPAGIAIADAPDGQLRYVNNAALGIRMGSKEELVNGVDIDHYVSNWNLLDLDGTTLSPEEVPLTRAIRFGETNDRQLIVERPDKEQRIVWTYAAPVTNDSGEIIAGVAIFRDITEAKKAEESLRESEKRLQRIISNTPVPMCVVDTEGKISLINHAFTRVMGYSKEDVPTMNTWWDLTYPDMEKREQGKAIWARIIEQAGDHGLEIDPLYREVARKDGKLRTVEFRVMPLGDTMVITLLDLTDQLRMVEELTSNEALLAEAQQIASLGSWEWNIQTGALRWSDEVFRIFGLNPGKEEMSYDRFLEYVHPADRGHVEESIRLALEGKVPYNIEHRIILPDGTIKTLHERGRVEVDDDGTPLSMVGSAQDISELKEIESQLIRATKMESIGQLAAGIAHEINTPTQFLQYNLKFFQESFDDFVSLISEYIKLSEATASDSSLQDIHGEIKRLADSMDYDFLMNEIPKSLEQSLDGLDRISRIVQSIKQFAHTSLSEKQAVDINQVVDTVITVSTNEWKYHSDVHLDLEKQLPLISCAPDLINQALLNLVVNAAHANVEKVKSGTLEKAGIYISTRYENQSIVITIRDDGIGIPEEIRGRIFDPFFTTKDVGKGTGQGLAMVQRTIVAEHGGTIDVESREGSGTTFTVSLPA